MKRIIIYLLAITLLPQIASAAVGKTEGSFSVSPTGAATYTIPIKVQSGLSDFVPNISLVYSSQSGNGIAGVGFGISGLSAISIAQKNIYFDGHAEAIKEGADNAFALDGQRLLLIEGPNGQTGAVYRTENEQYNIISITASQNGTPATFQVKATNGTTFKYGSSTGRHTLSNGESYQWALDYAEDVLGNYIQYNYFQEGVLYPTSITYGRNTHGPAGVDCTVSFTYESRPDSIPVYMFGEQRFLKKRLKSIVCKYAGNVYRTYTLNYTEDVFSHLTSVTETGRSSATLPPTTFEWEVPSEFQLNSNRKSLESYALEDFSKEHFFSGDLDGDGITELISMETKPDNPLLGEGNSPMRTWFYGRKWNQEAQKFEFCYSADTWAGTSISILYSKIKSGGLLMHASHGKGNSLVMPYVNRDNSDESKNLVFKFMREGCSLNVPLKGHSDDVEDFPLYTIFDADKDGLDNILIVEKEKHNGTYPASLVSCNLTTGYHELTEINLNLEGVPDKIRCADFNADGMTDLLITTSEGYYIYWNRSGSFSDSGRYPEAAPDTAFKKCDILELGDFNGDGLVDLLINKHDSKRWYIAKNTGNSANDFFVLDGINYLSQAGAKKIKDNDREEAIKEGTSKEDRFYCLVHDFNGDGKSDAVVAWPHPYSTNPSYIPPSLTPYISLLDLVPHYGCMCLFLSNGDTLSYTSDHVFEDYKQMPDIGHITIGNFDGQVGAQVLYHGKGLNQETIDWHLLDNPTIKPSSQKIVSITDGLGATDSIGYSLLTDEDVYSVDKNHNFPLIPLAGPIPVVKTRTESIPTDSRTTNYSYANGFVHLQGKGFLGFEDMRTESSIGIVTDTHCQLDSTFYVLVSNNYSERNAHGVEMSRGGQSMSIERVSSSGTGALSYKTTDTGNYKTDSFNQFGSSEISDDFDNGFPLYQLSDDGLVNNEQEITYWESPLSNVYLKGLPQEIAITKSAIWAVEGDNIYENIIYERDPATGLVLKETRSRNDLPVSTDGYSYNEYGQVTRHYTVAYNSTDTLVTRYEYNDKGQLKKEYDPRGLYRQYTYSSLNGTLSAVRDFDAVTTRYTYDGFLRETTRKTTIETCQTTRALSNYGGGVYSIKEAVTGKTPVTTYYDAWERKIAESAPLADGTIMYTDYHYLSNGQLGFVSFPHKRTETTQEGTTYTYDASFRKTSAVDSNGKTSTWAYSPMQITSCIDGVTTEINYYSPDKVHLVEDENGGVAEYFYNVDKALNYIAIVHVGGGSDYEEHEQHYEYDTFGRLIQTTDVNGVVKEYSYDVNGYPFRTTIGGSYVETNYDKYGILRSKTWSDPNVPSHTVTYTYDSKYRLTREQGEGYYYTYSYDQYGRLTHKHNGIGNDQLEYIDVDIQYSSGNLISNTVSYFGSIPTCITEQYSYQNGYRISDVLNDTLVWELTSQDKWGHPKGEGDFIGTTSHSFDDYGNMLSMNRLGRFSISESYTYNIQTGNMSAKNNTHFSYDNMNRLIGWGNYSYTYDNKGNITSQPIVGNLSYDGFRVTDMSASSGYFPDDSLRISYCKAIERPMSIENEHYKADIYYDGAGDRYMMKVYVKEHGRYNLLFTRFYLDANAEVTVDSLGHTSHLYYAGGDSYTSPAVMVIDENEFSNIYHISRDNIGSAIHYENSDGVCYQNSYSPWGVRTYIGESTSFYQPGEEPGYGPFYRTYTGHEDLWMFGLINANARLYSPYLGRFISPDPLLNSEGGPLDYNPYIYARNNPYKYIDRNGEIWWWAIFAALGAGFNVWQNWDNINSVGDALFFGAAGAAAGAFGGAVGPAFASGVGLGITGAISGAVSGAMAGFVSSATEGLLNVAYTGDFSKFSLTNCLIQTSLSAVTGGVVGGIQARMDGLPFWKGDMPMSIKNPNACNMPEWHSSDNITLPHDGINTNALDSRDISNLTPKQIGDMGEDWTESVLNHLGHNTHRQISTKIDGITNKWDFFYQDNGINHFIEVKSGFRPRFTTNQKINIPKMTNGAPYMFKGGNAGGIKNINIGKPITGPRQVTIFRWIF